MSALQSHLYVNIHVANISILQSHLLHAAVSCWTALRLCVPLHGLVAAWDPQFACVCYQLCWTLSHLLSVLFNSLIMMFITSLLSLFVGGVALVVVVFFLTLCISSSDEPRGDHNKIGPCGIITGFFLNLNLNIISLSVFAVSHFIWWTLELVLWHCFIIFAWLLWNCF